jgi:hypothetical protein
MMKHNIIAVKLNILLALAAAVAGLFMQAVPAGAASAPVKVMLGESSSTTWDIGPIAPGDSGYRTVSIQNTGERAANLNIWLSNINGQEGTPAEFVQGSPSEGGDLPRFLLLALSADGLTSSFSLPATVDRFPTEVSTSGYLYLAGIRSNQTVNLTWHWLLPQETGNAVQGDSLIFDINYTLTEIPAPASSGGGGGRGITTTPTPKPAATPSPAPTVAPETTIPAGETAEVRLLELELPDTSATVPVSNEGELVYTLTATTADQVFSLTIDRGTRLYLSNENRGGGLPEPLTGLVVPDKISVTFLNSADESTLPQGWVRVSPFVNINGIAAGQTHGIKMDSPAHLVIQYDAGLLPENVDNLATFSFSTQYGWTQLQPPEGFIAEAGQAAADTDHFSLFVVLARAGKEPPLPAYFEVSGLTLDPPRINVKQSSEVMFRVANTGGLAGEYRVVVTVNERIQKTQFVSLGAGESREIHLILSPGINGIYSIEVSGITAQLIVDPASQADVVETSYWWMLFIVMGSALLILAVIRGIRRKSLKQG